MLVRKVFCAAAVAVVATACAEHEAAQRTEAYAATEKPGASVSFSHELRNAVAPGESGVLELTINENYTAGTLDIAAISDGVDLAATSRSIDISMDGADQHRWDVYFDAREGGVHYIDFSVTATDENGTTMSRAYSAAVQVGNGAVAAKPDAPITIDAEGEPVHIMDANETIEE